MEIVAKIYLNDEGLLTFEALSGDVIENRLYPSGGDRIGVVVIDTENNLEIAENAIEPLKNLFKNSVTDSGDMGDIDMFKSDDEKYCLSWIGPNKRIFKVSEKVYRAGSAFVYDDKFKIKK